MEEKKMLSFNSEFSEFELQQLEERLETDPLAIGGLADFASTDSSTSRCFIMYCPELRSCPELR